jgi:TolB-like protein/class 3 adenylate cyclase/Tfp pilus assembly protein PilF
MTNQEVKRKLTAILSADVKGYSRLMGEDEESTVRTLNAYKEVMTGLIQHHRGRVVGTAGDSMLAEFASVVDAVRCAVEIQKELKTQNDDLPENRRMEFRIGVNLGDVIEDGEQILGDGVNIAARLESLSEAGGICISGTAYDQVENKLWLGYKYLGEQAVKNIAKPVRVYRVLMEPEAAEKVLGEKKAKPRQWQMVTMGLVIVVIVVFAAIVIWKFYIPSAPQPEVVSKEKIATPQLEKPSTLPPATEVAPKEKLTPPPTEKITKPAPPPAPKMEVTSKEKMAFPLPDKPSIAVLPFSNMSGNPEQEYFCDGLSEEIINALSNLPQVFVIARNSTFTYKGKAVDVKQVGREMGVQYVMEGSIRREGNRLRITAQLIDALTGRHVFSERYDRELKEIFAIQDEIAIKVLTALRVALTDGEFARFQDKGVTNLEAYFKLLEAKELANRVHRESNAQARRLAEEALSLDPRSARAYYILALTHFWDYWLGPPKSPDESIRLGIEMAQKAISLDENFADAHGILGMLYINKGDYEKAVESGERAASLAPNSAGAFVTYGSTLMHSSRPAEAIPILEKALRLSPVKPFSMSLANLGNSHRMIGKYEEAVPFYKRLLKDLPMHLSGNIGLTATYAQMGRMEDAREQAAALMKIDPRFSLERWARTMRYRDPADTERSLDALRKAGLK